MTKTTEMISVMQAYADSKSVECRTRTYHTFCDTKWHTLALDHEPRWDWQLYDYRVAPEPPKRVMMQMYLNPNRGHRAYCLTDGTPQIGYWEKVGEPFEFELPEGGGNET